MAKLEVRNLTISFRTNNGAVRAVRDISFNLEEGETLAIAGESGSGKSVTTRAIMGILAGNAMVDAGEIIYDGKDLLKIPEEEFHTLRGHKLAMVFQDPLSSLSPWQRIGALLEEPLRIQGEKDGGKRRDKVLSILEKVGLSQEHYFRYPHELSGGQVQRMGIARALIMEPDFIIADEPISALDVSIRAQVLNLLSKLQKGRNLTYLFIAHDLSVVRFICDRIAVIHKGKIVELAQSEELFAHPLHPYTRALLSAIPQPDPIAERQKKLIVYDPSCHHYSETNQPDWCEIVPGHFVLASEPELEEYRKQF